jgi:hypothetical protein
VSTINRLKEKIDQIPVPFKMMYKPPEREGHVNLVEYLDEVDQRLKTIEENCCGKACGDLPGE